MSEYIDIVFDGSPSHESGRFIEVENDKGEGINFGEWVQRSDGYWVLRITSDADLQAELAEAQQDTARPCKWAPLQEGSHGDYETACGHAFSCMEDGVEENNFKFCPYCGGTINAAMEEADGE